MFKILVHGLMNIHICCSVTFKFIARKVTFPFRFQYTFFFMTNRLTCRRLVEELIENLNKAAQEAKNAVTTFGDGLRNEVKQSQQRFENNLNELRNRIENSIKSLGEAASACVTVSTYPLTLFTIDTYMYKKHTPSIHYQQRLIFVGF